MERDLGIAREIQMGLLPADLSPRRRARGSRSTPSSSRRSEVGGDLFEVLRSREDRVFVAIGDVFGKGIPASLFMAVTMTLLRTIARQCRGPEESCAGERRAVGRTRGACS